MTANIRTRGSVGSPLTYQQGDEQFADHVVNIIGNASLDNTYNRTLIEYTGTGSHAVTLPDASTLLNSLDSTASSSLKIGWYCRIYNNSDYNLALNNTGTDEINGTNQDLVISPYETVRVQLAYNGTGYLVSNHPKQAQITAHGTLAPHRNLVIKYVSGTTVDVDADEVLVSDGSNYVNVTIDSTINMATTGVDALDTGTQSANWYHVWAIYNGSTAKCIASLEGPADLPLGNLPSGYTYYGYLGAFYATSGSAIRVFHQMDTVCALTSTTVLTDGTSTSYTSTLDTALNTVVPSTAKIVIGNGSVEGGTTTSGANLYISGSNSAGNIGAARVSHLDVGGGSSQKQTAQFRVMMLSAQTIYYKVLVAGETANIEITGYEY